MDLAKGHATPVVGIVLVISDMRYTTIEFNNFNEKSSELYIVLIKDLKEAGFKFVKENEFEYDENDAEQLKLLEEIYNKHCPHYNFN